MQTISVVLLGRIIGAAIIIVGVVLAFWNTAEFDLVGADNNIRSFLSQVLNWVAFGALVYLGAEILDQLVLRNLDDEPVEEPQEVD
jgi:uncharacterized membrane protein